LLLEQFELPEQAIRRSADLSKLAAQKRQVHRLGGSHWMGSGQFRRGWRCRSERETGGCHQCGGY
jgi:hypothetical protein